MNKVLVVEDEEIIRKGLLFTVDWLRAGCVVVGEAADGNEGLAKIAALQPDIVITDVKMPFKDGLEMLAESIAVFHYEAIILSGYGEFEYAQKAIALGVTDYLLKPIDFEQLYLVLAKAGEKLTAARNLRTYQRQHEGTAVFDGVLAENVMTHCRNEHVQKLLEHIRLHYQEKISLSELSDAYGFSSTYLNTKFKQETNYTFNDFLNRYRIVQAADLLRQNRLKVYEVAEAVGFQDYKYFNQVFKKYVGQAPGKFISSLGEEQERKQ